MRRTLARLAVWCAWTRTTVVQNNERFFCLHFTVFSPERYRPFQDGGTCRPARLQPSLAVPGSHPPPAKPSKPGHITWTAVHYITRREMNSRRGQHEHAHRSSNKSRIETVRLELFEAMWSVVRSKYREENLSASFWQLVVTCFTRLSETIF